MNVYHNLSLSLSHLQLDGWRETQTVVNNCNIPLQRLKGIDFLFYVETSSGDKSELDRFHPFISVCVCVFSSFICDIEQ